ncbi:MAG: outer membrane lipoprotein carrier protein LolA [Desulfarculaceae bacterium]|nr:outer membrane lipoprotein carrier protein LolA [Desulfarculaceae bacterium]
MRKTALIITAVWILPLIAPLTGNASSVLDGIEKKMALTRTLTADFVQIKHLAMFETPVEIRGTIHMEKPDKLAWQVQSPIAYSLIMDGETIIKKDGDTGKTNRISIKGNPVMDTAVRQIKLWFSGEYAALEQSYKVAVQSESPVTVRFEPGENNPAGRMLDEILVRFREDEKYISVIRLLETNGDTTEIRFSNIRINRKIPDAIWNPGK